VRGLVGKGLCLQSEGVHIAFTTSTGVLAFLDLAALLLRVNLGLVSAQSVPFLANKSNFKLVIYASFNKEEDYPGLSLLEGLEHVTKEKKLKNFALVKCAGENSIERWNEALIDWELKPYLGELAKVYVAGSPAVS